jgi:hypothetical protein
MPDLSSLLKARRCWMSYFTSMSKAWYTWILAVIWRHIIYQQTIVNNAFQKEWFGKFDFKIDKILKKSSPENERSTQSVVFNSGYVKHIHGQFKTNLKLRNIYFKQILAKTITIVGKNLACLDILLNPFCFVSYRFLNLYDTISFDMLCFHCAVWCSDCCIVFSKQCKVKSVIKTLFQTM